MPSEPRQVRLERVESWLEEYGNQLLEHIYSLTGDVLRSEEVLVQVFITAFEKSKRNRKVEDRYQWLVELCVQICGSRLASRPRQTIQSGEEVLPTPDRLELGVASRVRIRKTIQAAALREEVEQKLFGGMWTRLAVGATVILGVTAVVLGLYRPNHKSPVHSETVKDAVSLPVPLQNLPVITVGQYVTPTDISTSQLKRYVVTGDSLYNSTLRSSTSNDVLVDISRGQLSDVGSNLTNVMKSFVTVRLTPPPANSGSSPRTLVLPESAWHLSDWTFDTVNNWGVITANWSRSSSSHDEAAQVYILNLTTRQVAAVRSWVPIWHLANQYSVHVGANRLVVQSALSGSAQVSGVNLAALPIQVYTISKRGKGVLSQVGQVESSFGYGENPTVLNDGIVFQSLLNDNSNANSALQMDSTWYKVSWNDQFVKLSGPPLDGQPHWAVRGESGQLWWAETTPDMSQEKRYVQVVMAPLSPETSGQSQADTLSGAVLAFSVSNQYVLWVQDAGGTKELVISSVQ